MSRRRSIYETILRNMKDGELERGFSLPPVEGEDGVDFVDGAQDGIAFYHMGPAQLGADGTRLMIRAIKLAAAANVPAADAAFSELGRSFRAIRVIDDVQRYILKHADALPAGKVYHTALSLVLDSADRESVKFGLAMLELLKPDRSAKEVIRRVGLSDEFTAFTVWNMMKWEDGNSEIFDLIRKVRGWGRIHALEKLKPQTPEIREWILLHGIQNDVMACYSALTVWNKAEVANRLYGQLSPEEFRAIGAVLAALLDEGPVPGISAIADAESHILQYLSLTDAFPMTLEDYETVFALQNRAAEEGHEDVVERCIAVLYSKRCRECVAEAVKRGEGMSLAKALLDGEILPQFKPEEEGEEDE